jgi:MFS family permease
LFGILGFHVGVWAVQLASLSAGLGLDPTALGSTITVATTAGLVTLLAGGASADRVGRCPVLVIGFAGTGTAFVLLALAGSIATLMPAVLLYGLAISFVDLGANIVGSADEQAYAVTAMTGLHAWFSAGTLTGAIGSAAALRGGGVLLSGFGIGNYHFASLLERLTATAVLRRFGERRVVQAATTR